MAVIIAGFLQLILGIIKAGDIASFFPTSVIKGLLTSIGIILIFKQIPHAFGYDKDAEGDFIFNQADKENTFTELLQGLAHLQMGAIIIAITGIWTSFFKLAVSSVKAPILKLATYANPANRINNRNKYGMLRRNLNLRGSIFNNTILKNSAFILCNLEKINFEGSDLTGTTFEKCNLKETNLNRCTISGAGFENCNIDKTVLDISGFISYGGSKGFTLSN